MIIKVVRGSTASFFDGVDRCYVSHDEGESPQIEGCFDMRVEMKTEAPVQRMPIVINFKCRGEYAQIIADTNVYLLNDEGKTIEKLY